MANDCRMGRYLTAYADGELGPRLKRKIERHLGACEACSRELDSIVATTSVLRQAAPPPVSEARWKVFRSELRRSLDRVDREALTTRPRRIGELVFGTGRRRVMALAGACAVVALAVVFLGPAGQVFIKSGGGNECVVESIESYAPGCTPMFFTSEDPEMTVIWVFSDESGSATETSSMD